MKKVLIRVFSAILLVVCIVGLIFGGRDMRSALDAKTYWEDVKADALANFDTADDGIAQLAENNQAYVDGTDLLVSVLEQLKDGQKKLYYGQAALNEGQAQLAANKQAYEEGKAKLAKVQPIYDACMGHYNAYLAKQAEYDHAVESGNKLLAAALWPQVTAMKATYEASLGGMSMGYIINEYNAGQALINQYEEGQRTAADAAYQISEGGKTYEKGTKGVEDAKVKLGEYEAGQAQLAEGMDQILAQETYLDDDGEPIVTKISDRFDKDWTYYDTDENGNIILRNDAKFVNLDKASELVLAGRAFVDDTEAAVTHELTGRILSDLMLIAGSVIGLVAAVLGLCALGLGTGICSVITAVLAAAGLVVAVAVNGNSYPLSAIAECTAGAAVRVLLGLLLVAAILTAVFGFLAGRKAPKAKEEKPAEEVKAEEPKDEALLIARAEADKAQAEAEKAKAEAEKAKADAERVKAELELARLKAAAPAAEEPATV